MEAPWYPALWAITRILLAIGVGLAIHSLVFVAGRRLATRTRWQADEVVVRALRRPSRFIFGLLALLFAMPTLSDLGEQTLALFRHLIGLGVIAALTWLVVALVNAWAELVIARHDVSAADNLEARRVHTQVVVLERVVIVFIVVLGVAAALMTFPRIREIGASLLVSAGFAGLAIGLAARPVLENLIAGLQLAFTQPIRIDDVVIIEGEWGWIEEITTTYVVVRIWDQRRLIVPFSKFISAPFQNWTRRSADILGTVYIYADYSVPVGALREELARICEKSAQWDGKVCGLQVTNATEQTIELRALVSASDSSKAWELRCRVREALLDYLQREHPQCLPRTRISLLEQAVPPSL